MTKPTPRKMRFNFFKTPQPPHDEDKYCVMAGCVPVEPQELGMKQPVDSPASIKLNAEFVTHDYFVQREADLCAKYNNQWPTRAEFLAAYEADKVDVANFELDEWAFLIVTLFQKYQKEQPERAIPEAELQRVAEQLRMALKLRGEFMETDEILAILRTLEKKA